MALGIPISPSLVHHCVNNVNKLNQKKAEREREGGKQRPEDDRAESDEAKLGS